MSRPPSRSDGSGDGDETELTRRSVLAGSAATLGAGSVGVGGLAAASGAAAGQATEVAVIPEVSRWPDANLAGFMVHVGGETTPTETSSTENCDHEGWPPEEILAYDATLINRKEGDTPEESTTLYIGGSVDVPGGALYLINTFVECGDYVGVNLEQVGQFTGGDDGAGATDVGPVADVEEDERPDVRTTEADGGGGFGAVGPGFGPLATVAGLLGGGALLRWRDSDE